MTRSALKPERGPFRVDQLRPGDRYELSDGHATYCAPTGGDGARGAVAGVQVLDTDPAVDSTGMDAGFAQGGSTLRAPDVAVGGVPDRPGWIPGTPPLAVEYASVGQDEEKLAEKIADLLQAGTRWVWVVRLLGPRRVEVHSPDGSVRTLGPGEELTAPGVLRNAVPVEALYDRTVAHELTLRNLLQRKGYEGLEEVRSEGRAEGLMEGRAEALLTVLEARGVSLGPAGRARILGCTDLAQLEAWTRRAVVAASEQDVLD